MGRIRNAFLSGTITDNPLTNVATTINSAGFANLPVIASPNISAIVLDPLGAGGAPEVVWVTAHSAAATSVTVVRGQEGSSARQHAQGVAWVHGATLLDYNVRRTEYLFTEHGYISGVTGLVGTANQANFMLLNPVTADCVTTHVAVDVDVQGGNVDMGIYEWDGTTMTRIGSTGSIACPAVGQVAQALAVNLYRGSTYYFAVGTSSNAMTLGCPNTLYNSKGIPSLIKAASFPLPATVATLAGGSHQCPFGYVEISGGLNIL